MRPSIPTNWMIPVIAAMAVTSLPAQTSQPRNPPRPHHIRPIQLGPASQPASSQAAEATRMLQSAATALNTVQRGQWSFRVERDTSGDGVPWRLIATPLSELAERLKPSDQFKPPECMLLVPVLKVPENLWRLWFDPHMADVVGIHYHEFQPDEQACILLTIHKVPADGRDGNPPADYKGKTGTRLEATLLLPLSFHLDQSLVIRTDATGARPTDAATSRTTHERGHGEVALSAIVSVLAGPQTWDLPHCTGRRSTLRWYWHTESTVRAWEGYHGGSAKLLTQRTIITLVPPTRWSIMLPLPPDAVTQPQIESFNDSIANADELYAVLDAEAQKTFHATHGQFEAAPEMP